MKNVPVLLLVLAAGGCGGKSTADWVAQLRSRDTVERLHAVHALAENPVEGETVVPALVELLGDPDVFVRRDAARALGRFGAQARPAVPALRTARADKNQAVSLAAADALTRILVETAGGKDR